MKLTYAIWHDPVWLQRVPAHVPLLVGILAWSICTCSACPFHLHWVSVTLVTEKSRTQSNPSVDRGCENRKIFPCPPEMLQMYSKLSIFFLTISLMGLYKLSLSHRCQVKYSFMLSAFSVFFDNLLLIIKRIYLKNIMWSDSLNFSSPTPTAFPESQLIWGFPCIITQQL